MSQLDAVLCVCAGLHTSGIRQHGGIEVTCLDTYPHAQEEDEVMVGIRTLCQVWAGMAAWTTAPALAHATKRPWYLLTIAWESCADALGGAIPRSAL